MSGNRGPEKPYVSPSKTGESRRLTDIGGKSGHHAVIIGQARGAGYLGDMQGFALPFALVVIAAMVSALRILLGPEFPLPLTLIGGIAALLSVTFGVFLSFVKARESESVNYIDTAKLKRVSIYLHVVETLFLVIWLNWLTSTMSVSGAVTGLTILTLVISALTLRIWRGRITRRRQLWER